MGVLVSGRLALRTLVPERGPVTILSVEPGDIFGWSAVLTDARPIHGRGHRGQPALVIDGVRLRAALKEDHALAASLYLKSSTLWPDASSDRLQLLDLFAR